MRDGKILWKIVERSMWFDVSFDLFLNCWHFWVVLLLALLSLRFCFVLTHFVWMKSWRRRFWRNLSHIENSPKEVNDILETFLPDSNFDTIIRLNALKTLTLNKIDKIKGLDEQLLSQLNEKDSEKELIKFLLVKINSCILFLK